MALSRHPSDLLSLVKRGQGVSLPRREVHLAFVRSMLQGSTVKKGKECSDVTSKGYNHAFAGATLAPRARAAGSTAPSGARW